MANANTSELVNLSNRNGRNSVMYYKIAGAYHIFALVGLKRKLYMWTGNCYRFAGQALLKRDEIAESGAVNLELWVKTAQLKRVITESEKEE